MKCILALDATKVNLFGQERWSVWDVRKKLGIVSHDLQRDYLICAEGLNVILSGFYASTIPMSTKPSPGSDRLRAREVMRELRIDQLAGCTFGHLSTGRTTAVLVGRASVRSVPCWCWMSPRAGSTSKPVFNISTFFVAQIRKGKTILVVTYHLQ